MPDVEYIQIEQHEECDGDGTTFTISTSNPTTPPNSNTDTPMNSPNTSAYTLTDADLELVHAGKSKPAPPATTEAPAPRVQVPSAVPVRSGCANGKCPIS